MGKYEFKNVGVSIVNVLITIGVAIVSALGLQKENLFAAIFSAMILLDGFIFENLIKNYKHNEKNKIKVLINIFLQCCIYISIYGLVLFIFKIEITLIVKTVIVQIFVIIYNASRQYISKISHKKRVIFYMLFFSLLIGIATYGVNTEMSIIDILVYSTILASLASAIFSSFIFIKSECK